MAKYGYAQQGIVVSGSSSTGQISHSLGQLGYLHLKTEKGSIRAGVQQPFEITTVSTSQRAKNLQLVLFPNPTRETLFIKIPIGELVGLRYHLYDLNGKSIKRGGINGATTPIDLNTISNGPYFLSIYEERTLLQTYQIIKN
jgi:hypothetical protein